MTAESLPPSPAKPKKPLWRRVLKWMLRVVVLLIVLGITAYAITGYWAAKTIHNEIARIRSAGEPLTFADLDALSPKVDRAQDAGPYYAAAAELVNVDYETDEANYKVFFGRNAILSPGSPEALAWAHRNLDQNRIPLDLIDRGSALPGCNSDIQLQYGIAVSLSHLGKPRALHNAASLRSRVLALEGHGDQAVESVISSLGLLRILDRQPVLIDALSQIAMLAGSCQDATIVLEQGHPSDAALQKLNDAMVRLHVIQPRQMVVAERVYYLEIMRNLIANGPQMKPADPEAPPLPEREYWTHLGITGRIMIAKGLPTYARYIDAASGDWPAIITAVQAVADTPASVWDQISGPSFTTAMVYHGRGLSTYRSTLIAIQIERFRLAHAGQLPDSLAQLPNPNELPRDPCTGNALLYVKTPDGYRVFSARPGRPEDSKVERDKDPVTWSQRWGIHIRIPSP